MPSYMWYDMHVDSVQGPSLNIASGNSSQQDSEWHSSFNPLWCMQLEAQRAEARDLTSHVLTKEQSLGKLQVEVSRLSSSVTALR